MRVLSVASTICNIERFVARPAYTAACHTMAIRREDGHSPWERRAPLAPSHVRKLVKQGVKVLVQPSNRRAYPMMDYQSVGAVIKEDISEADLIIGVKQVPIERLIPEKTYAFFSHTIKAQKDNMDLLDSLLRKNVRLIDYEKMVDDAGNRVVAFGTYAGVAGMINILHGIGVRLLALGHHTPFMFIGPAHNYRNTWMAKQALRDAGYEISIGMMPRSIGPITFVFTGSGNVSQGAQEIFQELPHEYVEPENLHKAATKGSQSKVYGCVVSREDNYVRRDGGGFCAEEFESHPEKYRSVFFEKYAPYASCIVNGIYYAPNSPRLITIPDAKSLLQNKEQPWLPSSVGCPRLPHRLLAICDVSADPGGSIEFMRECTTIDKPFCLYDAEYNMNTESFAGDGVIICSVDNMPAQIPREATDFFGSLLLPHIHDMLKSDAKTPFENYSGSRIIKDAIITSNGSLTPKFTYIDDLRKQESNRASRRGDGSSNKRVLVLGAGYVSGPVVEYLSEIDGTDITIASGLRDELDAMYAEFPTVQTLHTQVNAHNSELSDVIAQHDLVISLLPYSLHPMIARHCIDRKVNMVTASYCSPEMRDLHQQAVEAGVTIVNEVGVDPGIDHMLAMECIDAVKENGGKITSYVSWCGGLPAPEVSENSLRYKFSWSPRGVLLNVLSGAKYLQDGEVVEISEGGALLDEVQEIDFLPGFSLEGFANRDSTAYSRFYGIESAHTILRGTLRYKGFNRVMKGLVQLGLISTEDKAILHPDGPSLTWRQLVCDHLGISADTLYASLKDVLLSKLGGDVDLFQQIESLGLFLDDPVEKKGTAVDTLSNYLAKRLAYDTGERDLIIMRHIIGIKWSDGREEQKHVNFVVYGDNEYSAMAKTVGYPTAIAARMVLEGEIQTPGNVLPVTPDMYRPILRRLKKKNFVAKEWSV